MPSAEFFEQFGLFAFREFLDRESCHKLCDSILQAEKEKGDFRNLETGEDLIDETVKKRSEVIESSAELEKVTGKLEDLCPEIEKKYNDSISGVQRPKCCLYETGDFYGPHIDNLEHEHIADGAKLRKVSAIIFLNDESQVPEDGKYCGGNLTFYGLIESDELSKFGLPLVGEQGMLVTFPPTLAHEVTKVTAGKRYTIATWFI